MMDFEEGIGTTSGQEVAPDIPASPETEGRKLTRRERTRRLLILTASIVLLVFLVYLLLILIYPSMNIGMNP